VARFYPCKWAIVTAHSIRGKKPSCLWLHPAFFSRRKNAGQKSASNRFGLFFFRLLTVSVYPALRLGFHAWPTAGQLANWHFLLGCCCLFYHHRWKSNCLTTLSAPLRKAVLPRAAPLHWLVVFQRTFVRFLLTPLGGENRGRPPTGTLPCRLNCGCLSFAFSQWHTFHP